MGLGACTCLEEIDRFLEIFVYPGEQLLYRAPAYAVCVLVSTFGIDRNARSRFVHFIIALAEAFIEAIV